MSAPRVNRDKDSHRLDTLAHLLDAIAEAQRSAGTVHYLAVYVRPEKNGKLSVEIEMPQDVRRGSFISSVFLPEPADAPDDFDPLAPAYFDSTADALRAAIDVAFTQGKYDEQDRIADRQPDPVKLPKTTPGKVGVTIGGEGHGF